MTATLSRRQKDAVAALAKHGFLTQIVSSSSSGYQEYAFQRRVLQALVAKGLAEPARGGDARPVGWAERQAYAEEEARQERTRMRRERVDLLASDPRILADAVVTLEARISRVSNHWHNVGGGIVSREV